MQSFTNDELTTLRDTVPHLDLVAMRALRRAGFDIVRIEPETPGAAPSRPSFNSIPRPMQTASLVSLNAAE